MSTAPVAIGNSVRGISSQVLQLPNGVKVVGRDYCFTAAPSPGSNYWGVVGGTPITPAAFSGSNLRAYTQYYAKFKVRKLVFHYITSSGTDARGDVAFYYSKNRTSVFLSPSSPSFLPMLMTDSNTVLGPQWVNHSVALNVTGNWLSTDYGMNSDVDKYAAGDIFLLYNGPKGESPGYVLMDYEIDFMQHQLMPRSLTLPIPRIQWWQTNIGVNGASVTVDTTAWFSLVGLNLAGSSSSKPPGWTTGDVYKVIFNAADSKSNEWTPQTVTPSNMLKYNLTSGIPGAAAVDPACPITDGTTLYALTFTTPSSGGNPIFVLYPTVEAAVLGTSDQALIWNATNTLTFGFQIWISYVSSINTLSNTPNY